VGEVVRDIFSGHNTAIFCLDAGRPRIPGPPSPREHVIRIAEAGSQQLLWFGGRRHRTETTGHHLRSSAKGRCSLWRHGKKGPRGVV